LNGELTRGCPRLKSSADVLTQRPRLLFETLVLASAPLITGAVACKEKPAGPAPVASEEPRKASEPAPEEVPTVKAYPPGVTPPPEAPKAAGVESKTGVCAFRETGYDGQDTRFSENLVVRIKDGQIVGATYSYKGSYAQEADEDGLSIPIRENEWATLKAKASSGPVEFKVRVTGDRFKMRGTAAQDAEGQCTWGMTSSEGEDGKDGADGKDGGKAGKAGKKQSK
jgi:hypothetical protein